ncbi:RagB/SusD family nutrient uptake outer membrane protein [Butyricimonas virosa]|uniref:RagB/SusD family nutrient uptake outer membrane protein n=1 Tax=Butyricimonas virosa TaxID=544645 RepID=UPI0032BF6940
MKKVLLYITLFATLSLASCNDWLDVKPETQTDEKDMFETVSGFKNALTACYIKLNSPNLYGLSLTITDIEFMAQHWSYQKSNYRGAEDLKAFKYENDYPKTLISAIYGEMYNTIAQANIILQNMPEHKEVITNEDMRAIVEAEALTIRAFCHMEILRLFGQMPQNASQQVSLPYAKTISTVMIPYYSFNDFTNLILTDLDAAETLFKDHDPLFSYSFQELDNFFDTKNYDVELADEFMGFRRFRFNYYAVKAIRARLYMYMGKKTEAYTAAREIIDAVDKNGKKVLELAGAGDINSSNFALPSECILALSNYEIEDNIRDLFKSDNTSTKIYLTEKYNQPSSTTNMDMEVLATQKQVIPLIRLSEMYLIAIESAPTQNEANALYIPYMKARNVDASPLQQEQLMTEIIREYRREFFGEGQMFYTYKRLGIKNMLWKTDREVGEQDYVVPLLSTELTAN